jgi:hypothetical protein
MADEPSIGNGTKPSEPGWLGLEALQYTVDWNLCSKLGEGTVCVRVEPGSPASRKGLKTRDYVLSVNGVSFEVFQASGLQLGAKAIIKAYRDGQIIWAEITIGARPKPTRKEKLPSVRCGAEVPRSERWKWLNRVTGDPALRLADKLLAVRLMVRFLNRHTGVAYPGIKKLAADLGVARRSIDYALERLHRTGYIDIISGRKVGRSNVYTPTWPASGSTNVLRMHQIG